MKRDRSRRRASFMSIRLAWDSASKRWGRSGTRLLSRVFATGNGCRASLTGRSFSLGRDGRWGRDRSPFVPRSPRRLAETPYKKCRGRHGGRYRQLRHAAATINFDEADAGGAMDFAGRAGQKGGVGAGPDSYRDGRFEGIG